MSTRGPVQRATRAFIADLGTLSPRQAVDAAQLVALATTLDAEPDGSKAATLSRELRQLTDRMKPAAAPATATPDPQHPRERSKIIELENRLRERQRRLADG